MAKLQQLQKHGEDIYPVTSAKAVKIKDDKTLADYKLADALDILQSINTIFNNYD
jgi:hypothetical protein